LKVALVFGIDHTELSFLDLDQVEQYSKPEVKSLFQPLSLIFYLLVRLIQAPAETSTQAGKVNKSKVDYIRRIQVL
jgi:hypothetical protein